MAIFGCICTATVMMSVPFIFGFVLHKAIEENYEAGFSFVFGVGSIFEWFVLVWMLAKLNGLG